jgi:hypothetical protein
VSSIKDGNIDMMPLEERLASVPSIEVTGGKPADPNEVVDLHSQSDGSDGHQTAKGVIKEAKEHGVYLKGASDHVNFGSEDKQYESSFYGLDLADSDGKSFREVYPDRYNGIQENIDDMNGVVSWQNADLGKLVEDLHIIREYGSNYGMEELRENVLNYDMVVMNAFEPDFNPLIEKSEEESAVEEYVEELREFVIEAEEKGAGFDHVNQAVHDVFIDGKFRYVKKPRLFEDLTLEEKEETLEVYRKKLIYAIEEVGPAMRELGDEIGAGLRENGLTVSIVHPAIFERNYELMQVFNEEKEEKAVEETQNFIYGHESIPYEGNEIVDENIDKFFTEEEIEDIYPEEALREFWKPVIEAMEDAENVVLEVNGKHVERFYNSVLWEMVDEYIPGSDQHREGEHPSRSTEIKHLNLDAEVKTPIDMFQELFEEELE